MYVEDVEDVKDRSNTPKGCNAMYVKDVEDGKRTYMTAPDHCYYCLNQASLTMCIAGLRRGKDQ